LPPARYRTALYKSRLLPRCEGAITTTVTFTTVTLVQVTVIEEEELEEAPNFKYILITVTNSDNVTLELETVYSIVLTRSHHY
jgi:hypothetical protein